MNNLVELIFWVNFLEPVVTNDWDLGVEGLLE